MSIQPDFDHRNRVALLSGAIRAAIGSVPHTRHEIMEAAKQAADDADKAGVLKHNAKRFQIGLNPGDPCTIKLKDGSLIRGALVRASGSKRVTVASAGLMHKGEWVPDA